VALAVLLALATRAALGQRTRVYLAPFGGGFVPTTELGSLQVLDSGGNPVTLDSEMQTSAGGGARLSIWPKEALGIEGSLFFTKSSVRVTDGTRAALFDGRLVLGSVKALWQVSNGTSGTDLVLSGGLAGANHGGQAFRLVGAATDLGGVAGAALYILVGPQIKLRLDGELFAYSYSAGPSLGSRTQLDLSVTAGLNILLSR
jgi:hypothetical protein